MIGAGLLCYALARNGSISRRMAPCCWPAGWLYAVPGGGQQA